MEYSFKIFGTGYFLKIITLNPEQLQIITDVMCNKNIPLTKFFFDFDYLKKIGYNTWEDIPVIARKTLVKINSENKIELNANGKRIINDKTEGVMAKNLLFPMYPLGDSDFLNQDVNCTKIVFGEEIFGQILHCKFTASNFDAFNLKFDILNDPINPNLFCFADVYYNNLKLISKSNQYLSRSFVAFYL